MRKCLVLLAFTSIPFFSGCAVRVAGMPFRTQRLTNYSLNEVKEVSIGDPIIDLENVSVRDAYEVANDYQTPSIGILASQQAFLRKGERFTAVAYNPEDPEVLYVRKEGSRERSYLIQIHRDGRVNQGWVFDGANFAATRPVQGSWTKEQLFIKSIDPSRENVSFKAQIIYSGIAGKTIKAVYREFANDFARPAFSQDLQYNLDEGKIISYKSIKLDIVKATNSSIWFKVIEDGGLPWMPR